MSRFCGPHLSHYGLILDGVQGAGGVDEPPPHFQERHTWPKMEPKFGTP